MGTMDFDIRKFDRYRENNRLEVKKAGGGIPNSLWETYSAMANGSGGMILLGVAEKDDGSFVTTGLKDVEKLRRDFWNTVNNRQKVSVNLLVDEDVDAYEVNGDAVLAIHVPRARREDKPVYIDDNMMRGTFRRNGEGDYHCTRAEIKAMLRDQTEETSDMKVLSDMEISDLDIETIHAYRNRHAAYRAEHVWEGLTDEEYLERIGAAKWVKGDKELHPTAAGLLMFGEEYRILYEYPEYFLDYREMLDPSIRWTDRLQSSSGDWTGNLFDFFFRVYAKLVKDLKIPFRLEGVTRIDDTLVHKALREALANCLVNADFFVSRGIVIRKMEDTIIIENPGYIRTGKEQMLKGGISDPRNKALIKMFNMIGIGERAGSGVPDIFAVWESHGWEAPKIEEQFNPDRTILTLSFVEEASRKNKQEEQAGKTGRKNRQEKQAEKASRKNKQKKQAEKTSRKSKQEKQAGNVSNNRKAGKTETNKHLILGFLERKGSSKATEIAEYIGLSSARTRVILSELAAEGEIQPEGAGRSRRYQRTEK